MKREIYLLVLAGLRRSLTELRIENDNLRNLKQEAARVRASVADFIFANSEKVIDATSPSRLP